MIHRKLLLLTSAAVVGAGALACGSWPPACRYDGETGCIAVQVTTYYGQSIGDAGIVVDGDGKCSAAADAGACALCAETYCCAEVSACPTYADAPCPGLDACVRQNCSKCPGAP